MAQRNDLIDWKGRYDRLTRAAVETRERAAELAECKLTDYQRNTLMTVFEPLSEILSNPDYDWDDDA